MRAEPRNHAVQEIQPLPCKEIQEDRRYRRRNWRHGSGNRLRQARTQGYTLRKEAARAAAEAAAKAEAERLAAEKAAAEKAAAEKAAAEKAAAEKAAAEKAAAEAAARAAAERARICAENSTNIFFTIGSSTVRKAEMAKINKLVEFLMANPDFSVEIVGYADKLTGSAKVNMNVSKYRVESVQKMLIKLGVPAERISSKYLGDTEQPFSENDLNRVIVCTVK